MEGYILSYRLGGNRQYEKFVIVEVPGIEDYERACSLIGRKVVWISSSGKKFVGKIVRAHGRRGRLLARFEKPLPGQALGTKVAIK